MSFFGISDIISNLVKMGIVLSEKQLVTLQWRVSEEGKQNYTQEETNKFYEALSQGKTEVIDVIRKQKQDIIDNLKQDLDIE